MNGEHEAETAPMALAEAAECCGMFFGEVPETPCLNCPLLVERRREQLLRHARAM